MKSFVFLLLPCVLSAITATAAGFHVAPGGSDANPGTSDKPFATLAHARDAARRNADMAKTIHLAAGRYFLTEPLVLDERDSHTTWRGAGEGAAAEIYGGVPVTGWEKWSGDPKGNIWRAPVPKGKRFFNLIVDGKPATMAQMPKKGSGFGGGAWGNGNGAVGVPKEWWGYDYSDAQVFCFIGGNWFSEMREVLKPAVDAKGILPIDGGSGQFGGMNNRFFLRGVLEFITEPGEWCVKNQEGFVYYWPALRSPNGESGRKPGTPADHLIVRPTAEKAIAVIGGSPATPARGITIENLSVIGSDFSQRWYLFQQPKDGTTPAPLQQGMVFGENVEGLSVKNCRLLAAGHSAVWLNHAAKNCVVENNLIQHSGFAGVYMNGWDMGEGPFKSGLESYVNKGHRIEGNFIHDCGQYVGGGCGIQFYQSGDNLITRNTIGQMPRYGISYKGNRWGCLPKEQYGQKLTFDTQWDFIHTRNNKLIGNDIFSVCRNSFDFGGIESWGPGRDNLWANNDVHDIDQTLQWDGWAHILFADDSSHYLTTRDNILHHCHGGAATGAFMMKSIGQEIANNLVADCQVGRLVTLAPYIEPGWDFTVRRNVFALDGNNVRYDTSKETFTGMSGTRGSLPAGITKGIKEVDYNCITPKNAANPNPAPYPENGIDKNAFFGDPLLKRAKPDWDMTGADYSLAPESPAFKLGFKTIPTDAIGIKKDFPFDTASATRRLATDKIQAEDYQRMRNLRTSGGANIYAMGKNSWSKYTNIDFGSKVPTKAVFEIVAQKIDEKAEKPFVRQYGDTTVESTRFNSSGPTVIEQWEVSELFTVPGKNGAELFNHAFAPENDIKNGNWKPWLAAKTARNGVTTAPGEINLDIAHGEHNTNACAYLRTAIHIPAIHGQNTTAFTLEHTAGIKLWVNGELIMEERQPGTHRAAKDVALKAGWNTVLIKATQDDVAAAPAAELAKNFSVKVSMASSLWPSAVYLPGLPTEARSTRQGGDLIELRLGSPDGRLIGRLAPGQSECPVEKTTGIHNLYLVFLDPAVRSVDWFTFQ